MFAATVDLPSPGRLEVTMMVACGLSRLLRVMPVRTVLMASLNP